MKLNVALTALICLRSPFFSTSSLIFGAITKECSILSASCNFSPTGLTIKQDVDRIFEIDNSFLVAATGDQCDCDRIVDILRSQNREYVLSFGRSMSCKSLAHFCGKIIYGQLRKDPYQVQILIAGWNGDTNSAIIFWLDSLGAIQEVTHAAHGRDFSSILSILDANDHLKISASECVSLFRSCWNVVRKRSSSNIGSYQMKGIGPKGIIHLE